MALTIKLKSSAEAEKRPVAASLAFGEVVINYNNSGPGVFFASSTGDVIKVGPAAVGATAPNSSPAGSPGNSVGEFWYDTSVPGLKIWDGSAWVSLASTAANATPTLAGITYGCTNLANAFYGYCSGVLGASSGGNAGLGVCSLSSLTNGSFNTALGDAAGSGITTGSCNIAIGCGTQVVSPTGSCQLAIGFSGTDNWLTGTSSKAIKPGAGIIDSSGSCGTIGQVLSSNGANALLWATAGGASTATPTVLGIMYGRTSSGDTGNMSLGYYALNAVSGGCFNTALGSSAGIALTSGSSNTLVGSGAATANMSGSFNTVVGADGGTRLTSGGSNVLVGYQSGNYLVTCSNNVAVGHLALRYPAASVRNVAIGTCALSGPAVGALNGGDDVAIGFCSQFCARGTCSVSIGSLTLQGATGGCNIAIGVNAGCSVSTGSCNTILGHRAGEALTSGCNNTYIGYNAGTNTASGFCCSPTLANTMVIGNCTQLALVTMGTITFPSDIRIKKVHGEVPLALPFINSLTPIDFHYCNRLTGEIVNERRRYGFSAQNVLANEVDPENPVIVSVEDPECYSIAESMIVPALVNAIKELSATAETLQARVMALENKIASPGQ